MFSKSRKSRYRIRQVILFALVVIFCTVINNLSPNFTQKRIALLKAHSTDASALVKQGADSYQAGEYQQAIAFWQQALDILKPDGRAERAIVEENIARTYQKLGDDDEAIAVWLKVADYYRTRADESKLGQIFTEQAQLYSSMGQPRKAFSLLCGVKDAVESDCLQGSALQIARTHGDSLGETAALGSLGNTYRLLGDYDRSIFCLQSVISTEKQIDIVPECQRKVVKKQQLPASFYVSATNSLGNTYASRAKRFDVYANSAQSRGATNIATSLIEKASSDRQKAAELLQTSLALVDAPIRQMQTLLNLIELGSSTQRAKYWQQAVSLLEQLPDSRHKVYAAIELTNIQNEDRCVNQQTKQLLDTALATAQNLQDNRARSFALGELGHFYECRQQYNTALEYTRQAQWQGDSNLQNQDSLYLWEWQEGRILHQLGRDLAAIPVYQRAIATLDSVRDDLITQKRELQLDFRDNIEPLYREFARLNLESISDGKPEQRLDTALEAIDKLRIAELENYFGYGCSLTTTDEEQRQELLGNDTAVFNSIILEERVAIIVSLPDGSKRWNWIETSQDTFRQEILKFKAGLLDRSLILYSDTPNQKPQAEKLYNWIIAPFKQDLESARIKTLVFVQDGLLRNIPMSPLYDGERFLIEQYAIATTSSLSLTQKATSRTSNSDVVAFGLSEPATVDGEFFPTLTQVQPELASIARRFPNSTILLNQDFTRQNFRQALEQAVNPIVHIATHGQFGTIPQDSFLVLGSNQKLTITELEAELEAIDNLDNSLRILALTACETAVGDERATLGLAGTAVRAGVESTLASLWSIPDESTKVFVDLFYGFLQQDMSKAQALRSAQLELITAINRTEINDDYSHPFYWSAFITIGNWL